MLLLILNYYYFFSCTFLYLEYSSSIVFFFFHVLFLLIHLTTMISWSTRVRAVAEEDKELSLLLFPFPTLPLKFVDNSSHDPCDYKASIVFVQ